VDISITDAELELMRVLWKKSPLNARQITQQLSADKGWHRKTVNTLLSRLRDKLAVSAKKHDDGVNYFEPLVDHESFHRTATSEFIDQLFGGEIAPLIACFAKERPLSDQQIAELKTMLSELSDDGK
jgi:BlaI family penicillinase repressor